MLFFALFLAAIYQNFTMIFHPQILLYGVYFQDVGLKLFERVDNFPKLSACVFVFTSYGLPFESKATVMSHKT